MKTKLYLRLYLSAILAITLLGGSVFAAAKTSKPKVTLEEAQAVALARIPGTVESSMTGKKDYSFEILGTDGVKTDVFVSEKSGKIKKMIDK